jgi:hypothetical protein
MSYLNPDNALEVLLEVRNAVAPELDETLLRDCYAIQKRFQFDRDREVSLDATRRLIEHVVEQEATAGGDQNR